MSKVLIKNSTLTNIAEAIREHGQGNTSLMKPSEMPEYIANIDTEKVTIDDYKVTEKMNLYSFQNQVVLDIEPPPTDPPSYEYQGKLYDGSKLYMKTTLTQISDGSSSSSAGCTGTVLLINPNGTQLSVPIPIYTIPSRSETGSSPDSYTYNCRLYFSPDENIYLILEREFKHMRNSSAVDYLIDYWSIYKLNISSSLSWTNKVIEVTLGPSMHVRDYIIENDYIYVVSGSDNFTRYIYVYSYGDTSYKFQKISTYSISYDTIGFNSTVFVRKNTNTYIYFWGPDSNNIITSNWISITRHSHGTYSENKGKASLSGKYYKIWEPFMLNGEVYIWMLGLQDSNIDQKGFYIYKLNSDNSAWEIVYNIANADTGNTTVTTYLNNAPDTIFQGGTPSTIRFDGTFDLIEFSPGTLYYSQIPTPTIMSKGDYENWYYYSYRYNNTGQKIFFFRVVTTYTNYYDSRYKCVLEAIDGSPVLYSTFRENDITGLIG